jgi:hypothetical protein
MPASDPITAIFGAVGEGIKLAGGFIEEARAQRYEEEHKDRLKEWRSINALPDRAREQLTHVYVMRLLDEAGATVGSMGDNISVPVGVLHALINEVSEGIKKDKILNRLQFKG